MIRSRWLLLPRGRLLFGAIDDTSALAAPEFDALPRATVVGRGRRGSAILTAEEPDARFWRATRTIMGPLQRVVNSRHRKFPSRLRPVASGLD